MTEKYFPALPTTPRPRWRPPTALLSSILCFRPHHWPLRPPLRPNQVRSNIGEYCRSVFFYATFVLAACFWKEMGRFNVGVEEALKSSLLAISCQAPWSTPSNNNNLT